MAQACRTSLSGGRRRSETRQAVVAVGLRRNSVRPTGRPAAEAAGRPKRTVVARRTRRSVATAVFATALCTAWI